MDPRLLVALENRAGPWLRFLPPAAQVALFSRGRRAFLQAFNQALPDQAFCPQNQARTLWGIRFRSPLFNAAGVFKQGDGYALVARQGAGAYLAGTSTARPRAGNCAHGVEQPFALYRASGAASNWLGLPNPGHRQVARRLAAIERQPDCPIGASLAACPAPDISEAEKLDQLILGLRLYEEAGVDFLELNESCPNTEEGATDWTRLAARLRYLGSNFLQSRQRRLPVWVKFSCDTLPSAVPRLLEILAESGFDGINFGNTSTDYALRRQEIATPDRALYDHFVHRFGGGVSGRPLKAASLTLARAAVEALRRQPPVQEFHVVRTGGIEGAADLAASDQAGVALNQWFSGYFAAFAEHGHEVYAQLLR